MMACFKTTCFTDLAGIIFFRAISTKRIGCKAKNRVSAYWSLVMVTKIKEDSLKTCLKEKVRVSNNI